jgi:hypothetical protein
MTTDREMPKYRSHKEVWALKIKDVLCDPGKTEGAIIPEEEGFASIPVSVEYMEKHDPQPGGYYVVYPDGYKSWSPAKAFESGYTRVGDHSVSAVHHESIEEMIKALGCDGERITPEAISDRITSVDFETVYLCGKKFMYCGIKMDNGFVVVGEPAVCLDPVNWRDSIGRTESYKNAFSRIWELEAYRKLSEG